MKKLTILTTLLIALAALPFPAIAANTDIPPILKAGFEKYQKEGPKAAIEAWTRGSALEGSKEALAQANSFRQIEDFYGKYVGYDLVKTNRISDSSSIYLIDIRYEKGDLFSKFFTYEKPDGQLAVTTFKFHTNAEAVWPASVVFGDED